MGISHTKAKTVKAGHKSKVVNGNIWEEIDAVYEATHIREGEVTLRMLMEKKGMQYSEAAYFLSKLEQQGKLVSRLVMYNGKQAKAYRKP